MLHGTIPAKRHSKLYPLHACLCHLRYHCHRCGSHPMAPSATSSMAQSSESPSSSPTSHAWCLGGPSPLLWAAMPLEVREEGNAIASYLAHAAASGGSILVCHISLALPSQTSTAQPTLLCQVGPVAPWAQTFSLCDAPFPADISLWHGQKLHAHLRNSYHGSLAYIVLSRSWKGRDDLHPC